VEADDLTGITAVLVVPGTSSDDITAEVLRVAVSADGTFLFENVPSPARYQLVVSKPGYASEIRNVSVGAAQKVENIEVMLRKGDGVIRGRVNGPGGPLGGATVEVTDGLSAVSTVSLTDGDVGAFALRSLATPATYTITVSRPGYTSETRTVNLAAAQDLDAGTVVLQRATGSLSGTVSQTGIGAIGGVTVTITAGDTRVVTSTASVGNVGTFYVDQLPIPATYNITFSRAGLDTQVRVQDLDPNRVADATGIDVAMPKSSATVAGVVRNVAGDPVANATVTLTDGSNSRTLITAHEPLGRFSFSGVSPGSYTLTANLPGSTQAVQLVTVLPNVDKDLDISLSSQASVVGRVMVLSSALPTTSDPDSTTAPPTYVPYAGATVRIFAAGAFPGGVAIDSIITNADGYYAFTALEAPQNYVIAVYQSGNAPDPLDSIMILTQPSTELTVTTFEIPVIF
ncbi:MAG TPA: carboxypeptidase-like regulatory domain-containing protein, partial [Ilumatobacteraceae bacterium]|nr:carboxypeptidase-like regulatory domain-containing protein [Ilumatobacteraceae bacterium]